MQFSSGQWSLIERMHADFNDREAHTHLPMPIARFRETARKEVYEHAKHFDDVKTVYVDDSWLLADGMPDTMARYMRLYNDDVDEMMRSSSRPRAIAKGTMLRQVYSPPTPWPAYRP